LRKNLPEPQRGEMRVKILATAPPFLPPGFGMGLCCPAAIAELTSARTRVRKSKLLSRLDVEDTEYSRQRRMKSPQVLCRAKLQFEKGGF
jgi:hypothetical protein